MTIQKLASEIAKREGKKSQVSIGNIREILRIFIDIASDGVELTPKGFEYSFKHPLSMISREIEKRILKIRRKRK